MHTVHAHCTNPFELTVSTEKFTNPIETGYILLVTLEVVDAEQWVRWVKKDKINYW